MSPSGQIVKRKERTSLNALSKVYDIQRGVYCDADDIEVVDDMLTLEMTA